MTSTRFVQPKLHNHTHQALDVLLSLRSTASNQVRLHERIRFSQTSVDLPEMEDILQLPSTHACVY